MYLGSSSGLITTVMMTPLTCSCVKPILLSLQWCSCCLNLFRHIFTRKPSAAEDTWWGKRKGQSDGWMESQFLWSFLFWQNAAVTQGSVGHRRLSATKWGSCMSRERFDIESPNFTRRPTRNRSVITPNMTLLATSGRKLLWQNCWKCDVLYGVLPVTTEWWASCYSVFFKTWMVPHIIVQIFFVSVWLALRTSEFT